MNRFLQLRRGGWLLAGMCALTALRVLAAPFTYQGRLVDGASLANGSYELTFRMFDSLAAGTQVGGDLVLTPVGVTNGLFTVELDFGDDVFTGAARWLELSARVTGAAEAPETLTPRQAINAVPYALRAFAGPGNAAELTTGTLPDARLSANIARTADLASLSNALTAKLTALESALNTLSNQVKVLAPASVAVSAEPADAALQGAGWVPFSSVPAPVWSNGSTAGAPSGRTGHSAVWTGQAWLVWGGTVGGGSLSLTGASYDAAADQWSAISELNPPAARQGHSAVWTGSAMLVWGGVGGAGVLGTGGSFSPTTLNWTALPTAGAPVARQQQVGVWTGSRLLIWGGRDATGLLADGKLYDPAAQAWTSLPDTGAPEARMNAVGVWTGSQFIVWGGQGELGDLGTGAVLPLTGGSTPGAWAAMQTTGAPTPRSGHTLVWTGSRVLVWGGKQGGVPVNTGAAYDPVANTWTALPTDDAPAARFGHVAAWTGGEMLVFGGQTGPSTTSAVATGAAFNPATGQWRPLSSGGGPLARTQAAGVWTGTDFLVFGGTSGAAPLAALQRLNPQPTWYFYRKP